MKTQRYNLWRQYNTIQSNPIQYDANIHCEHEFF